MKKSLRFGLIVSCLAWGPVLAGGAPVGEGWGWGDRNLAVAAAWQAADDYLSDAVPAQFDLTGLDARTDRQRISTIRTARSEFENRVTTALGSANALSAGDQELVRNWVGQVLMTEMTSLNPDVQTRLGDLRQELFRKFIRATANDNNRNFLLNNVVLPKATDIASKNYHPAARVNAALIIGLLDTQEGISGQRPPRPNLRALGALLTLIDDPQTPEYLVAACLSGVQRHAEIDGQMPVRDRMQANARQQLVDSMLKLLNKYESKQTELEPGYILSRRAMQTLAGLNLAANDPPTAAFKQAANQVADNANAGKWLRLDAMLALAKLPLDDPIAFLERVGRLVVLVAKTERAQVLEAQKMIAIDKLIKDKTGMAMVKKKSSDRDGLPVDGPSGSGAGAAGAALGMGDSMSRGGMGGMGGFMDLSGFDDSGLFPYHLHYARTNVKVAAAGGLEILGTRGRTPSGLKVALSGNTEATKLIDQLDREFKKLISITDIGLVEEKPLTEAQRRAMDPVELNLLNQSDSVRVLAGIGRTVQALEKLVGAVEVPGASGEETTSVNVRVAPSPIADPANGTSEESAEQAASEGESAASGDQENLEVGEEVGEESEEESAEEESEGGGEEGGGR